MAGATGLEVFVIPSYAKRIERLSSCMRTLGWSNPRFLKYRKMKADFSHEQLVPCIFNVHTLQELELTVKAVPTTSFSVSKMQCTFV